MTVTLLIKGRERRKEKDRYYFDKSNNGLKRFKRRAQKYAEQFADGKERVAVFDESGEIVFGNKGIVSDPSRIGKNAVESSDEEE